MTQYANPIYWWHFLLCDLSHVNKKHDMNKTSREIRKFSRGHLYCYLYEHSSSNTLSMWMPRSWNIQHQTLRMKLVDTSSVISTDYYIKYTTWMIKYATIMTLHKSSYVECLKINVKEKILITEFQTQYDGSWPDHLVTRNTQSPALTTLSAACVHPLQHQLPEHRGSDPPYANACGTQVRAAGQGAPL